jgi:hypothetical protein
MVKQVGRIRIVAQGHSLESDFLITDRVGYCGERGLLSVAFPPDYSNKICYFYANYTNNNGNTVIVRFHLSRDDPNQADPNSEEILLTFDQPIHLY